MLILRPAFTTSATLLALFVIVAPHSAAQAPTPKFTVLHSFGSGSDGFQPHAGVVIGSGGVLYGTTIYGGAGFQCVIDNCGIVFSLTPPATPGGAWTETVIHNFIGADGGQPYGGVVVGRGGVLYGATAYGGASKAGTVYALVPPPSGNSAAGRWHRSVLYHFTGGNDGGNPFGSLVIGRGDVLYGTTQKGGTAGLGTAFSLTPPSSPGGSWTETVIHNFTGGSDGSYPQAGLAIGEGGVLYGTTAMGGPSTVCDVYFPGCGTVFSLIPPSVAGGTWTETVIQNFSGPDGADPQAGVSIGSGGVLYGINYGVSSIFSRSYALAPPASPGGAWTETVLSVQTGASSSGTAVNRAGVVYGTTQYSGSSNNGSLFSLTPPAAPGGAWTQTFIYSFGGDAGGLPYSGVVIGRGGVLYGTTGFGGASGGGTVYEFGPGF